MTATSPLTTALAAAAALTVLCGPVQAQEVKRVGAAASPISQVVAVPSSYTTYYVAGITANPGGGVGIPADMDSKAQTVVILEKIKALLAAEGLGLGDIVMMRVYLVGVPSKDGRMDNGGMNEAYKTYFGTAEQPNKPSRATIQVAGLGSPTTLVEIEAQAVRKK